MTSHISYILTNFSLNILFLLLLILTASGYFRNYHNFISYQNHPKQLITIGGTTAYAGRKKDNCL